MSRNNSFKDILNNGKCITNETNTQSNLVSKNEPTTPLKSSKFCNKRSVNIKAATTTRKKTLEALKKCTSADATQVTVVADNIQTTIKKNSRTREPPPGQLRINAFFKSCTKSYKIEPLSVKEEVFYSTAQNRKMTKVNKKSAPRRGSRARGAKGRKRLFKENEDSKITTVSSVSDYSVMPSSSKNINNKRTSASKTRKRSVKRSKAKINLQSMDDLIDLCSSSEKEEEKDVKNECIASDNLAVPLPENNETDKHVTTESLPMVNIPVNQNSNDRTSENVSCTKVVKYHGDAIYASCSTQGSKHKDISVREEKNDYKEQVCSKKLVENSLVQNNATKTKDELVTLNTPPTLPPTNSNTVSNTCRTKSKKSSKSPPLEESSTSRRGRVKKVRICPPYKKVDGTTFAVDAFHYGEISGVTHYFLTHFHSDHYQGLTRNFAMPLYASPITARLVRALIPVRDEYLHEIDLNSPLIIDDVEITAIDANHCPGAVMFIFKLTTGRCILHTGDFRATTEMESEPIFWNNDIDTIYLDTTYMAENKNFCTQNESISRAKDIITQFHTKRPADRVLYICGSYLIGKERFWASIAQEFDLKVWTEKNRFNALQVMDLEEVRGLLCEDPMKAQMHVISLGKVRYRPLVDYFQSFQTQFDAVLAFRPSGWEKSTKPQLRGIINIVGIEYSEHSSHAELKRFVTYLKPREVISTVPVMQGNSCTTPIIPETWYKYREIKSRPRNFQLSITSFMRMYPRQIMSGPPMVLMLNPDRDAIDECIS